MPASRPTSSHEKYAFCKYLTKTFHLYMARLYEDPSLSGDLGQALESTVPPAKESTFVLCASVNSQIPPLALDTVQRFTARWATTTVHLAVASRGNESTTWLHILEINITRTLALKSWHDTVIQLVVAPAGLRINGLRPSKSNPQDLNGFNLQRHSHLPPFQTLFLEEFVQLAYVASLLSETDEQVVGSPSQPVYPYCEPQEWTIYPNHSAVSPQPSLDSASTSASSSVSSPSSSSPLIVPSSLPSALDGSEGVMTIPSGYESVYPHPHPPSQVTAVPFHQQYPYTSFASPASSSDSSFASPSPFWPSSPACDNATEMILRGCGNSSAAPSLAPVALADAELASPMSCYSMSSSSSSHPIPTLILILRFPCLAVITSFES
ncbi:hypothetical protein D9757_010921 [Collybiopsis confluens]|uniref:Uncharacterized protein n=1 Tax=Collybiopsis confluens TaxID=2823264 RepID=A0A8H5GIU8_9AGAR|nr:hypothetical protein D9757_010921 [Collybiopsis confluens]